MKQWDTWRCNTLAIANVQRVNEALDPKHIPYGNDMLKLLFTKKQKYIYAVFIILQTNMGMALVCKYECHADDAVNLLRIVRRCQEIHCCHDISIGPTTLCYFGLY